MDEIEVPLEKVHEDIHHAVHHVGHSAMMNRAALLSAFLAVAAAIAALTAGHSANEAMIRQIQSSDQWGYYQAKGIKLGLTEMRNESVPSAALTEKIEHYKSDQQEIKKKAEELTAESEALLHRHETLAAAVTLFQIAIAMTAIAVLTRKRTFLGGASLLGLAGLTWLLKGLLVG